MYYSLVELNEIFQNLMQFTSTQPSKLNKNANHLEKKNEGLLRPTLIHAILLPVCYPWTLVIYISYILSTQELSVKVHYLKIELAKRVANCKPDFSKF